MPGLNVPRETFVPPDVSDLWRVNNVWYASGCIPDLRHKIPIGVGLTPVCAINDMRRERRRY